MSQRIMSGLIDWTGQTTPNGLLVKGIAQRHPLRWNVQCSRCKVQFVEHHSAIAYIRCRSANCGLEREREQARELARSRYMLSGGGGDSDEAMRASDTDSMRRFIDYQRGTK